jgi:AcrR family transcriptional regulator
MESRRHPRPTALAPARGRVEAGRKRPPKAGRGGKGQGGSKRLGEGPPGGEDGRVARAREQRRTRRDQILRAAERVFAERGYHNASIADVIDAAGTARGTFYLYFDSKQKIFGELLDQLFAKLATCVRPVDLSPGASSPLDQLRENVTCAMTVVAKNLNLTRMLFRTSQGIDPEIDAKVAGFNAAVTQLIGRALRRGTEIGIVRPLDGEVVSQCIYGSVKELVSHFLGTESYRQKPLPSVVDEILSYNLTGLVKK